MSQQKEAVHHPIFARMYTRMSARAERRGQEDHRRKLLVGLSGRVVEIGAGNGLNFAYYLVAQFRAQLQRDGVGVEATRRTLAMLQGIFARAVEWQIVPFNPVKAVRKPRVQRERAVSPLAPVVIERLRRHLLDNRRLRDATLISVLAYAGLRPEEALALEWRHVRGRKNLSEWRLACGRPGDRDLVFPAADGGPWRDHGYRNWRRRVYQPTVCACHLGRSRPYDLRHSFASLLHSRGTSLRRRDRGAARAQRDDDTQYLRARDRRAEGIGPDLGRGRDQKSASSGWWTPKGPREAFGRSAILQKSA